MCEKIVDVVQETFTKKYYSVRISQSKNGNIYLIVRKKGADSLVKKKNALKKKVNEMVSCVFEWYSKKSKYVSDSYFVDFKLIRECSGYHFQF